jgi:hypothetical protein
LQDCYSTREQGRGQETWFTIGSDLLQIFRSPVESGWRKQTRLFHQQRRRFGSKWTFSFWPLIFGILTVGSQLIKKFLSIFPFGLISIETLNYNTVYNP